MKGTREIVGPKTSASLELHTYKPGRVYVSNVLVGYWCRGQGLGSQLMQQVCDEADLHGSVLHLHCRPEMTAWYERFGFVAKPDAEEDPFWGIGMEREPRKEES